MQLFDKLKKINNLILLFGIDIKKIVYTLYRIIPFTINYMILKSKSSYKIKFNPHLFDKNAYAAKLGEYFWQDMYVAKKIIEINPNRHIDVGSRVDGFVSHLACVRSVEVLDIRPLNKKIDNVIFTQFDITKLNNELISIVDCVSCLHTLEHIGLGRYGDKISEESWKLAFYNLAVMLKSRGRLWLSVPVGQERIEFNAHRVFDPFTITRQAETLGLVLDKFVYICDDVVIESSNIKYDMSKIKDKNYALGIFVFIKK